MALSDELYDVLSKFGIKIVDDTRNNLQKKLDARAAKHGGKSVQSRLGASIKSEVGYKEGGIVLNISMNDYWVFVDKGRNAGPVSEDGQNKIKEWSKSRGVAEKIREAEKNKRIELQNKRKAKNKNRKNWKTIKKMPFERAAKSAAFLIARKLKNKSLEPTNFFSEVIKDGRIDDLKKELAELIKTDVIINIKE